MREKHLILAAALAFSAFAAAPARADNFAAYWRDARVKWNAVGDRAAAGDESALKQLTDAIAACAPETDCFRRRASLPEAEMARLTAAWNACDGPLSASPYPPEPAVERCRRNVRHLTQPQIDAAAAAVNVAWILRNGKLGEPDDPGAYTHYAFAAAFHHPVGHFNAGKMIMEGKLRDPDLYAAAMHYLDAGRTGLTDGWIELGRLRQKHGTEQPFTSDIFALEAVTGYRGLVPHIAGAPVFRNGAGSSPPYSDRDFFYRRALEENPTEAQKKTIVKKIIALADYSPAPAASATPPHAPARPQLREANMAAARACIPFADEMQNAQRKLSNWDRRLNTAEEELAAYDHYTPNVNYDPGSPSARAQAHNNDMRNAKADSFNRAVRERNAFAREADGVVDSYNAQCAAVRLTKAEHEAVCGGKSSNRFCRGFDFK